MDARAFDRWTTAMAHRPTRRAALRLLAGSLVAGLLSQRGVAPTRAVQRPDRDGDGLYDDDEVEVYGTNPDVYDTDGDGVGDGEEVYVGTDPLIPAGGAPPPPGGGEGLPDGAYEPAPPSYVDPVGDSCSIQGLTNCDQTCVDVSSNDNHCGACGNFCGLGGNCQGGVCSFLECPAGQTLCGFCADLNHDTGNCGFCGNHCADGLICCNGSCVDISWDTYHCGRCNNYCYPRAYTIGSGKCDNYECT